MRPPVLVGTGAQATRHHAHSLAARMISWVVGQVMLRQGGAPGADRGHPPGGWGPHKQELLTRSLADLGLDNVDLLSEPQAAALAFASTAGYPPAPCWRCTTWAGAPSTPHCCGRNPMGGSARWVARWGCRTSAASTSTTRSWPMFIDSLGADNVSLDPHDPMVAIALSRLRQECVDAKEALSDDNRARPCRCCSAR